MAKIVLTDRWMHKGQKRSVQQTMKPQITVFRDSSRGKVGFTACFHSMTIGKKARAGYMASERHMAFKLGQHACSGVESNPRKAVASALRHVAGQIERRAIKGGFEGYKPWKRR